MFRKSESTPESRLKARDDAALLGERIADVKAFVGEASGFVDTNRGQMIALATIGAALIAAGYVENLPV